MPPVTQALILINVIVFFSEGVLGQLPLALLALWPFGENFMPWQVFTYGFVHGGLTHLLVNMYGLYLFGSDVERVWGSQRFLTYYIVCVLSAAALQLVVTTLTGAYYPTVGASGGIFGLLYAFARLFPQRRLILLFPPIPMRAPVFVAMYGILELVLGVTGTQEGVAHFAHLGGLAGGYLYMRFGRRRH
ncbi:rhomboid family intramembrane serine protease [Propionivibrio soli]|jgi:membrane associated rhomboid family serine protease|uniref:rhomboid family intramembrane serine protease n=1 Tax=Propionivibrio soli TaxID=2976531 RepID=UPI0021E89024|nr:rhomboid family intramembrane serine protease [Propionivibrio soli]